jgi:hypothetical protein
MPTLGETADHFVDQLGDRERVEPAGVVVGGDDEGAVLAAALCVRQNPFLPGLGELLLP